MKGAMKKLVVSAFVLVVAISLATASTFAWFSMNTVVRVEDFTMNVAISDGITVAVANPTWNGSNPEGLIYKTTITRADFTAPFSATYFTQHQMNHVTTNDNLAFNTVGVDAGDGRPNLTTLGAASASTTLATDVADYMSFDLVFRSQTTTPYSKIAINLSDGSGTSTYVTSQKHATDARTVAAWAAIDSADYGDLGTPTTYAIGDPIDVNAVNAVRVGFSSMTLVGGSVASKGVWDPTKATDTPTWVATSIFPNNTPDATYRNLALDYMNYMYPTLVPAEVYAVPAAWTTFDGETLTKADMMAEELIDLTTEAAISGVYYGRIRVNIWLEGWDGECFDAIMSDILNVSMQFSAAFTA